MRSVDAIIAANRFGLGAGRADVPVIEADPRGWLEPQLGPQPLPQRLRGLPAGAVRVAAFLSARQLQSQGGARQIYAEEAGARVLAAIETKEPLHERLVAFWSNHFTVSAVRPVVAYAAGAFEREAIRPHVTGRFADMLLAVCRHPTMLLYLDNAASIGPASPAGQRSRRGLNENLAREILELHTIGRDAGYGQEDVRALAEILTGWSIAPLAEGAGAGAFRFRQAGHQPGPRTLLGRRFAEAGEQQGVAALGFLAAHPATARRIADKLARHFVADEPPPALVERLSRSFLDTGGDLGVMMRLVLAAPESWSAVAPKVRSPYDYFVAVCRACGVAPEPERITSTLAQLGQPVFRAPSPAGWPDRAVDWAGPEAMVARVEWAAALAGRLPAGESPSVLLERALGPAASEATRTAVIRAESGREGLALLLASPEFQRR